MGRSGTMETEREIDAHYMELAMEEVVLYLAGHLRQRSPTL